MIGLNAISYQAGKNTSQTQADTICVAKKESLYLIEKAAQPIKDIVGFESRVRDVARRLEVHPDWLMAVMYSESQFHADIENHKGSGAVGLIQFMPRTCSALGYTAEQIKRMSAVQQLAVVELYLLEVKERYGNFKDLTDLYLAVLYPKAIKGDACYSLYANPSKSYKQNRGLDENGDGFVCKLDIANRMARLYPSANEKQYE